MVSRRRFRVSNAQLLIYLSIYFRFEKLVVLHYKGKITRKEISKRIPTRTQKQVITHFHKRDYALKRKYGHLLNNSKNSSMKNMMHSMKKESPFENDQTFLHFKDPMGKDLIVAVSVLKMLVSANTITDEGSMTIKLDEAQTKTVAKKCFLSNIFKAAVRAEKK